MMRNRVQVDAHVSSTLKGLNSKTDKLMRGFNFAKMYYDIKEFDKAEEYLQGFLTVKANYAPAYKLLGQIYESTSKDPVEILEIYKKSFVFDNNQKDVLIKISELYANNDATPDEAKFWAEKAEKHFPNHNAVVKLKLKAQNSQGDNSSNNNSANEIESLEAQLVKYPKDVGRRVRLLRYYMSYGRMQEAYAVVIEAELEELFNTLEWYKCAVEILLEFKRSKQENLPSEFYEVLMITLCLYCSLSISQSSHTCNAVNALWSLDQELSNMKEGTNTGLLNELHNEMRAQYLFLCGTLILHKAQKENLSWRTLIDPAYACFLASMERGPLYIKFSNICEKRERFLRRWQNLSYYRSSQIGHILKKKYDSDSCGNTWLRRVQEEYFHKTGRCRISQLIYSDSQPKDALEKSFLCNAIIINKSPTVPCNSQLAGWDGEVQISQPENLELLVWICLHYYDNNEEVQPEYPFALYNHLPFGCEKLETSEPSTLCQLDIQTFLMAVVKCSAINHAENEKHYDPHHPFLLPLYINESLCSKPQSQWWSSIGQLQNVVVLRKGLEVVRLIGAHGMHVKLLTHLAKNWAHKHAQHKQLDASSEFLEAQAFHFWSNALMLIEKQLSQQPLLNPKICLFDSRNFKTPSEEDFEKLLQEGKLFHSLYLKNSNNLTAALKILKDIKCSVSYYEMAKIYKSMAEDPDNVGNQLSLLTKAKNAIEDARKMCKVSSELEKIRSEINDIEVKLLDLQNEDQFVSEFDCSTFGDSKFTGTPQKHSIHTKAPIITSSTPFSRKNRSPLEMEGTGLAYIMHYVDQKISSVNDDYKKLQDKVIMLENKIAFLEGQKLWMPMPYHMVPQAHLQVYPSAPMKYQTETDLAGRFTHPASDKLNQFVNTGYQQGMLPVFSNSQRLPIRSNPTVIDTNKFHHASNDENQGSIPSFGTIDNEDESGYMAAQGSLLPSIENNIFQRHNSLFNGKYDINPVIQKIGHSAQGAASNLVNAVPVSNVHHFASQNPISNSSLSQLLSSSSPMDQTINNVEKSVRVSVGKDLTTSSPISQNVFDHSVSSCNKIPSNMTCTALTTSTPLPTLTSKDYKVKNTNILTATTSGNLTFTSSPDMNKNTKAPIVKTPYNVKTTSANPLSNFTFGVNPPSMKTSFIFSIEHTSAAEKIETKEEEIENEEHVEDFEPTGEFKPLVNLPIVNVVTGEEDCNKLFGERGKLYRMDFETKQWKERGVGEIKVLENKSTKKARILMRRDQVFKVCANHFITADMKLKAMDMSENSYCWIAMDYAEEEMKKEHFCIKFKTKEIAINFKECFEACQGNIKERNQHDRSTSNDTKCLNDSEEPVKSEVNTSLSLVEQFRTKDGQWNCATCYVRNPASSTMCLACETLKPGHENSSKSVTKTESKVTFGSQGGLQFTRLASTSFGNVSSDVSRPMAQMEAKEKPVKFEINTSSSLVEQFRAKDGQWNCAACYVRNPASSSMCLACETLKPGHESIFKPVTQTESKFIFGNQGGFQIAQISSKGFGNVSSDICESQKTGQENISGYVNETNTKSSENKGGLQFAQSNSMSFGNVPSCKTLKPEQENNSGPVTKTEHTSDFGVKGGFQFGQLSSKSFGNISSDIFGVFRPGQENTSQSVTKAETKGTFGDQGGCQLPQVSKSSENIFSVKPVNTVTSDADRIPTSISFGSCVSNNSEFKFTLPSSTVVTEMSISNFDKDKKLTPFESFKTSIPMFSFGAEKNSFEAVKSSDSHVNDNDSKHQESQLTVEEEFYNNVDGEDAHIHFEPIIKLPENYEIKTLEENESVIYSENAKIFRFHNNEWKEKGSGVVKLLKNEDNGKVRVLMRRDKIHKICCNHYITADMMLHPLKNNNKALVWYAHDYVDGDQTLQQLCIKFKTEQSALEFKRNFEEVVKGISLRPSENIEEDCVITCVEKPSEHLVLEADRWMLPKAFYNYLNLPPCKGCIGCKDDEFEFPYTDKGTEKDAATAQVPLTSTAPNSMAFDVVSSKSPLATVGPGPFTFASLKQHMAPSSGFSIPSFTFGIENSLSKHEFSTPSAQNRIETEVIPKQASAVEHDDKDWKFSHAFSFGSKTQGGHPNGSNVFGSLSQTVDFASLTNASSTFKSESNFSWKGAGEKLFTSLTPEKVPGKEAEKEDEEVEVERDIHFEPIVNLPEVELMTGEENEDEIFKHRSVLYRFDGQWKERGVGDMKILKQRETGVYRLLMRRDQIHKVVCNHLLTSDMSFKFMESSEKALCWYANDFSEDGKVEQFALKFKFVDSAKEFKRIVEECQSILRSQKQ